MKLLQSLFVLVALTGCAMPSIPNMPTPAERDARMKAYEADKAAQEANDAKIKADRELEYAEITGAGFIERHPGIPEGHKQAIMAKKLIVGLNWQEARAIVGPILRHKESDGAGGKWSMWESVEGEVRYYLFFENDGLVRWETKN